MTATETARSATRTSTRGSDPSTLETRAESVRREAEAGLAAVRSTAGELGARMPELVDGIRNGAAAGAREVETLPEPTRRLVAAFSIGLGAGLAIAGAPRLLLAVAFAPAVAVAATAMRRAGASA